MIDALIVPRVLEIVDKHVFFFHFSTFKAGIKEKDGQPFRNKSIKLHTVHHFRLPLASMAACWNT